MAETYVYIQKWGEVLQSRQPYIDEQIALAQQEHAPANAISREQSGKWLTTDDIHDAGMRKRLGLPAISGRIEALLQPVLDEITEDMWRARNTPMQYSEDELVARIAERVVAVIGLPYRADLVMIGMLVQRHRIITAEVIQRQRSLTGDKI